MFYNQCPNKFRSMLDAHQFPVVEDPALVDVCELLGEGDGVLPMLASLQQVDHVQVQLLLPLPLLLRRVPERRGKIVLSFSSSHTLGSVGKCNMPPPIHHEEKIGSGEKTV